jgi:hypothetical protein
MNQDMTHRNDEDHQLIRDANPLNLFQSFIVIWYLLEEEVKDEIAERVRKMYRMNRKLPIRHLLSQMKIPREQQLLFELTIKNCT